MSAINDGGPAFPAEVGGGNGDLQVGQSAWKMPGMTLRDWFAGQALASSATAPYNSSVSLVANSCYRLADAMLAVRGKKNEDT